MKSQSRLGVTVAGGGTRVYNSVATILPTVTYPASASWQEIGGRSPLDVGQFIFTYHYTLSTPADADVEFRVIDPDFLTVCTSFTKSFKAGKIETVVIPGVAYTRPEGSVYVLQAYSPTQDITLYENTPNDISDKASQYQFLKFKDL
jgi:hypothetical protein